MKDINTNLKKYIEKNILPCYDTFDHGHDSRHINAVIERALEFAKELNNPKINMNIVYTSAAYHDIGMIVARKGHAKHSHDYVLSDKGLKDFFNNEEITLIAEACEDHSTSTGRTPRSIYGKIVSDADKDIRRDFLIGNYFKIVKHCEGMGTQELHFIHRSIYEYFVVVYFFETLQNQTTKEEVAGKLGELLKKGRLSQQILKFIKYKFDKIKQIKYAEASHALQAADHIDQKDAGDRYIKLRRPK